MYKFYQPVDVYCRPGTISILSEIMRDKGLDDAVLIADPFSVKCGLAKKIVGLSEGKIVAVCSDVEPNPTWQNIDNCVKVAKEHGAKCVIGLGGGSSMDCAKSTAVCLKTGLTGRDLLNNAAIEGALPIIAIPTTAGTGSEVTAGAVLSDKENGIKTAIFSHSIFPTVALVDSTLTYTCPPQVTASSGIDVIAHALDALTSVKACPATDALAIYAAKTVFTYLRRAYDNGADYEARDKMSEACVTAGLAFSQTGTTGSHACSYILTSKYNIPHGEACAFTLDSWFKINAKVRPELDDYARMMGFKNAEAVAEEINNLKNHMHLRSKLDEVNIKIEDLDLIAESSCASGNMANNVAQIGIDEVKALFLEKL